MEEYVPSFQQCVNQYARWADRFGDYSLMNDVIKAIVCLGLAGCLTTRAFACGWNWLGPVTISDEPNPPDVCLGPLGYGMGLHVYAGPGDPNYVNSVLFYCPETRDCLRVYLYCMSDYVEAMANPYSVRMEGGTL